MEASGENIVDDEAARCAIERALNGGQRGSALYVFVVNAKA
jgi:hypothetical protein